MIGLVLPPSVRHNADLVGVHCGAVSVNPLLRVEKQSRCVLAAACLFNDLHLPQCGFSQSWTMHA